MATIFKYLAQFIILPLIEQLVTYVTKTLKTISDAKARKEDNKKKVTAYEQAPADSASDDFSRLP